MPTKKLGSIKMTDDVLTPTVNVGTEATGTLPVANGGTGQTTYTDGQLLIGNTTGNTLTKATLTAGTGISVTNGAGSITIAATGGGTGDVVGDDTTTTVQNIVAYNTTGGKNITELTGTQGNTLYHNGTSWVKLAAGTSGDYLKTNGAGANPSWSGIPGLTFASGNLATVIMGNTTSRIYAADGASNSPGYAFNNSTGDGMGRGAGFIFFSAGNSERARIIGDGFAKFTSTGNYISATGLYHEMRSSNATEYVTRISNSNATTPNGLRLDFTASSPDNNTQVFLLCQDSTTARCYIYSDGDLANHDGTYGTISDEKLKQDIVDAPSQWEDMKAVRFRKYRMKTDVAADPDAPYLLGVIAQEIEQTSPMLVDERPDFEQHEVLDEDGNPVLDENGRVITEQVQVGTTKTVKSSILLTKAAVALQEAIRRIESLESEVAALKAIVTP